jgi:hypothetical protein
MVTIPYNNTDFHFTLNDLFLQFSTAVPNTYFTLKITINYYEFYGAVAKQKVLNYKIWLFQNEAEFNIGRKIHRNMGVITELNSLALQYKTALVNIEAKELNVSDDTLVATTVLDNIKFVAGLLPSILVGNTAMLNINTNASRITPKGFVNVSFLLPLGANTIEIYKNNNLMQSEVITATATDNVFTKKYKISDYAGNPGDVFHFKVKDLAVQKSIIIFPERKHSNHLLFIDEFNLLTSLECTGEFSFPLNYSQITHEYKRNLVKVLEIIETDKDDMFKINTGWVLKTDNITIDSLSLSKKAWLFINDQEVIEMVPISKKLVKIDSEQDLYEYDLEFQINRAYNAQNYTL